MSEPHSVAIAADEARDPLPSPLENHLLTESGKKLTPIVDNIYLQ